MKHRVDSFASTVVVPLLGNIRFVDALILLKSDVINTSLPRLIFIFVVNLESKV